MIAGLGSVIDRVTGLFGKTYFLAGFFPVLVLAAVSLLVGYDTSEWVHRQVEAFGGLDAGRQALVSGALLALVATLGFVYWSANPWFRAALQGRMLPEWTREWLTQSQQARLAELEKDLKECEDRVFAFRTLHPDPAPEPEPPAPAADPTPLDRIGRFLAAPFGSHAPPPPPAPAPTPTWMQRLLAARERGEATAPTIGAAPSPGLKREYGEVQACIYGLEPVEPGRLDALCAALEPELAATRVADGSELDRMHVGFYDLATLARARAENARNAALSARRSRFPVNLSTVGPTRMANVSELYRDHSLTHYRLDPEVFWLHLQRCAAADEQFRPILEEARLKLDVSVAMAMAFVLASLSTGFVVGSGHSVWLLVLAAVGFPIAALLFYHATIVNLRVYGEAVTATIDLFRFDVLRALHLPLPADSDAERRLWESLTLSSQLLGDGGFTYEA